MTDDTNQFQVLYDYSDAPTIRRFALCDDRIRLLMGPFGSGKSSGCVQEIIRRAHEQEPGPDGIRRTRWAVVRNSYRQLKDTTIKTFMDWYPEKYFGEYKVTDHDYYITEFPGVHCEVMFRALDRPDQISNLLSLEVTGCWFNEAREIPREIIEAMDSRIGRYPSGRDGGASWSGMFMDTNPPDEDSYLYKMFEQVKPDGWSVFKQPSGLSSKAENLSHLPKHYYINLAKGKDQRYIRVYIHGQYGYILSGQPVFGSFEDSYHVATKVLEPDPRLPIHIGMDFSIVGCVIGQVNALGQLRILDELTSEGLMGIRQFCVNRLLPLLRTKYFGMQVSGFGDPAGNSRTPTDESTCFEILHGADVGLNGIVGAPSNNLSARIDPVEHFLTGNWKGEPNFLLSPNCKLLRKALNGAYYYEKEKAASGETYKTVPVKNYASHVADALEYLCMFLVNKKNEDLKWKQVMANMRIGNPGPASGVVGY